MVLVSLGLGWVVEMWFPLGMLLLGYMLFFLPM